MPVCIFVVFSSRQLFVVTGVQGFLHAAQCVCVSACVSVCVCVHAGAKAIVHNLWECC